MIKIALSVLALSTSFCLGFAFNKVIHDHGDGSGTPRVHGIGGVFFKCKNPEKVRQWYAKHLGFTVDKYGTNFEWRSALDSTKKGFTQWSPFAETTIAFQPSSKDFMVNYRVENLENLVDKLVADSVVVTENIKSFEYGKFVHIIDCEGNKVELWEPNDVEYDKIVDARMR